MMRFICLGCMDDGLFNSLPEAVRANMMEECFAYDDELRRGGHFLAGEALQHPTTAVTLRSRNGNVDLTDGPFAETKEFLGGILFLEARDLNHAIQLMSKHPGITFGSFEIRPANEEINALIAARNLRNVPNATSA
jgi:hypothetical protein